MATFLKKIVTQIILLPLFSKSWDDLVFENRNTHYGAYELRRIFISNQFKGLIITISIFSLFIFWVFYSYDNSKPVEFEFEKMIEYKGFDANLLKVEPAPKANKPAIPKKTEKISSESSNKNLPPEVKKEEISTKEEVEKATAKVDTLDKKLEAGADTGKYMAGADSSDVAIVYEEGPASPYGGLAEFMKWVQQNLIIPQEAISNNVHGTIFVHFTVDEGGNITKVTLMKGLGYGCDEAVMDVLNRAPKWKPAVRDGKAIPQRFKIPVKI